MARMQYLLDHYKRSAGIVTLCLLFSAAAFAQGSSAGKVALSREELKLDMKSLLKKDSALAEGKQELKILPKTVLLQRSQTTDTGGEFTVPEGTSGARIFAAETGLIDLVDPSSNVPGKLNIDDCVRIAMKNHIPLQVAEKSVTLAKWRLWENRRNMLPTATAVYEEYNGEIYGRKYSGRKQYLEGQQPVFHGGELYYTMKQAETNLEVVRCDYERIKNDLVLQVRKAYYSLERASANLDIQRSLYVDTSRILDMINRQYEAKIAPKIEYLNVSSQASQVNYQLASAEGDVSMAELILKQAMNLDPRERISVEQSPAFKKVDADFDRLLNAAFFNRPEMKINSLLIDYYNYGKKIAASKGCLKLDLVGQWGLAKEEYRPQDRGEDDLDTKLWQQWYAGVKASMPFWGSTVEYQWMREQWTPVVSAYQGTEANTNSIKVKLLDKLDYYSDKQVAEIEFDKQRQELNKIKQDVTIEVKEGYYNYRKALIQLETAASKVNYQENDLEVVKLRRGLDEAQDSNIVDSMIKLAQEKFGYLQALADCRIAVASMEKAIGAEDYFYGPKEASTAKPVKKKKSKKLSFWFTKNERTKERKN